MELYYDAKAWLTRFIETQTELAVWLIFGGLILLTLILASKSVEFRAILALGVIGVVALGFAIGAWHWPPF